MLKISGPFKDLTESELNLFEKSLGHELPEDYRHFLLRNNGGFPNLRAFKYKEADYLETGGVRRFFGISENHDLYSLEKNISLFRRKKDVPVNLLPIAVDGVGNFILLSIHGSDRGNVSYWLHEIAPEYGNIFLIAKSFTEFLEKLFESDEEDN